MPKARANINVYSSARISGFIFECEKTVWYQELNHMMLMIDLTWCDLYTTNCEICGTKSSRNRSRCRKHERTSTYTAVRHLPISFLRTKWDVVYTRNCMVCGTKSDRPPCFVLRKGPSMPRRNWSTRREEPSIAITADLRPFVTHAGLIVNTAVLTRHPWRVSASISMQNVNWSTRRPPSFHHLSNYSSTPTYVVVVLFVVNQRSRLHTYSAEVPVWHTPV